MEQTKAMRDLNIELTRNQRKDNARFHTQNNFFSKEDRDKNSIEINQNIEQIVLEI